MKGIGFKHTLITAVVVLLLVAQGVTSFVALDHLKKTAKEDLETNILNSLSYEAANIQDYIYQRAQPVVEVATMMQKYNYQTDLEKHLEFAVAVSGASKLTLGFDDGRAYASRPSDSFPNGVGILSKYDARTRPWYKLGKSTNRLVLSDVFFTSNNNEPMLAAVQPVENGVMIGDVRLKQLQEMLEGVHVLDGAAAFITDNKGLLLASTAEYMVRPEEGKLYIQDAPALSGIASEITGQDQFITEVKINGINSLLVSRSIELIDGSKWFITISIASRAAYASVMTASWKLITSSVAIAVVFVVLLLGVLGRIYRPVIALRNVVTSLSRGDGDLTQRLQVNSDDDLGLIAQGINLFIENLQSMMLEVQAVTTRLTRGVQVLQSHSDDSAIVLEQHQKETELVATAMEELSATAELVAQNSEQAAQFTQEANRTGATSKQTILMAQNSLKILVEEVQRATVDVENMSHETQDIGSILNVIGGIADQTNLLALNAAIEAARAGEQGRGFAVVADEVRALAKRTQQSTGEIDNALLKLRQGAESVVSSIDSTRSTSEATVVEAAGVAESLESMSGFVSQINDLSIQISTSAHEQNAVIQEITHNMERIHAMVEQLNSKGSTVTQEAKDIAKTNQQLTEIVSKFKLSV
jgi:methyl-accepting chemotaxis protein